MITNTSMTLYYKQYNSETRLNEWKRHVIIKEDDTSGVMWQGGKGASLDKGYEQANDVKVFIPCDNNDLSQIKFEIGDIIVKGIIDQEITKRSDLKMDTYNIKTILNPDYGGADMAHIELGGK